MNPDKARILRITAAAGTELADAYSARTLIGGANPPYCSARKAVHDP